MLLYNFLLSERYGIDVARNPATNLLETMIVYTQVLNTFGIERIIGYVTGVRNYAVNLNVYNVDGNPVSLGAGTPFGARERNNIEIRGIGSNGLTPFNPIETTVDALGLDADYADERAVELLGRQIHVFRSNTNARRQIPDALLVGVRTDVTYAANDVTMNTALDVVHDFTLGTAAGTETYNQRNNRRDLSLITNFAVLGENGIAASPFTVAAQNLIDFYRATGAPTRPDEHDRPDDAPAGATAAERAEVAALQAAWEAYRNPTTGAHALRRAAEARELELARLIEHQTATVRNYRLVHVDNGIGLNNQPDFLYIYQPVQIGYVTRRDPQRLRIDMGTAAVDPRRGPDSDGTDVGNNAGDYQRAFHATTNIEGFYVRPIEGGPEDFVAERAYMFTRSGSERDDFTPIRALAPLETDRVLEATTLNSLRFRGSTPPVTFATGARFRALNIWGTASDAHAQRIRDAHIGGTFTVWGDEDGTPYFARRTVNVVPGDPHHDTFGWVISTDPNDQMQVLIGGRMVRRVRIVDAATGLERTVNIIGTSRDEAPAVFGATRRLLALRRIDDGNVRFYEPIVIEETLPSSANGFSNDRLPRTVGTDIPHSDRRFVLAPTATATNITSTTSTGGTAVNGLENTANNLPPTLGFNHARTMFYGIQHTTHPRSAAIVAGGTTPTRFMIVSQNESSKDFEAQVANNAEQMVAALRDLPIYRYAVVGTGLAINAGAARLVFIQTSAYTSLVKLPSATPRLGIMVDENLGQTHIDNITYTTGRAFELSSGTAVYTNVIMAGSATDATAMINGSLVEILTETIDDYGTIRSVVRAAATHANPPVDQRVTRGDTSRSAANLMSGYNAEHIGRFFDNPANLAGRVGSGTTTIMGNITGYSEGESITVSGAGVIPLRGMNRYNLMFITPHGNHGATNANPAGWRGNNTAVAVRQGGMSNAQFGHLSGNQRAIITLADSGYAVAVTIVTFMNRADADSSVQGFFDGVTWPGRTNFGWGNVRAEGAPTVTGVQLSVYGTSSPTSLGAAGTAAPTSVNMASNTSLTLAFTVDGEVTVDSIDLASVEVPGGMIGTTATESLTNRGGAQTTQIGDLTVRLAGNRITLSNSGEGTNTATVTIRINVGTFSHNIVVTYSRS
jgi:hypothetical protein